LAYHDLVQRLALVLGLIAWGVAGAAASPADLKRVAGRAVQISSVCGGGAAVSDEQIAQLPPPQPIAGMAFLVVAGDQVRGTRPAARFVTGADGRFVTRLPPGKWCFFEASRRPTEDRAPSAAVAARALDADCMAQERRRCDLVLDVKSDVKRAEIAFPQRCSQPWNQPCYRGPMPP
jgi:hypothetical protein